MKRLLWLIPVIGLMTGCGDKVLKDTFPRGIQSEVIETRTDLVTDKLNGVVLERTKDYPGILVTLSVDKLIICRAWAVNHEIVMGEAPDQKIMDLYGETTKEVYCSDHKIDQWDKNRFVTSPYFPRADRDFETLVCQIKFSVIHCTALAPGVPDQDIASPETSDYWLYDTTLTAR